MPLPPPGTAPTVAAARLPQALGLETLPSNQASLVARQLPARLYAHGQTRRLTNILSFSFPNRELRGALVRRDPPLVSGRGHPHFSCGLLQSLHWSPIGDGVLTFPLPCACDRRGSCPSPLASERVLGGRRAPATSRSDGTAAVSEEEQQRE